MAEAPADWYPDPLGRHEYRYWNGTNWTEHVADAGEASIDPLESRAPRQDRAADSRARDGAAQPGAEEAPEGRLGGGSVSIESQAAGDRDVVDPYAVSVVHEEPRPVEREVAEGTDLGAERRAEGTSESPVAGPSVVGAPAYPGTTRATGARDEEGAGRQGPGRERGAETDRTGEAGRGAPARIPGIRGQLIDGTYAETDEDGPALLQNSKMLKLRLGDDVLARQGSMVAFQGSVEFDYEGSGSVGRFLKKAMTGEGVPLMRCRGNGDLFLAHNADDVHLLWLDGGGITVSGRNVLAFHQRLDWDIQRVSGAGAIGAGLFNTVLSGTGWVAITTHGTPVVLRTDAPTFADSDAVVAWSSNLSTNLNRTYSTGAFIGRGSGEVAQLSFSGDGVVIVQASEGPTVPSHTH